MQETNEVRGLTEPIVTQMEETEPATAGMCLDDPKDMPTVEMTTTNDKPVITDGVEGASTVAVGCAIVESAAKGETVKVDYNF